MVKIVRLFFIKIIKKGKCMSKNAKKAGNINDFTILRYNITIPQGLKSDKINKVHIMRKRSVSIREVIILSKTNRRMDI